ncbi:MAG: ABC transporter ATP-binding protein [Leptolyngbyaceae cyanobacterium bins.302]|nr:ABC transporter ATP-binding protein [Leptolyngbyaceae cyanobacterium bins.302]
MLKYWSKFAYILGCEWNKLLLLILLFLVTSLLETMGVGLVGPFIGIATNPQLIHQASWLNQLYVSFRFSSEMQFICVLGLVIVIVLYLKAFLGFWAQKYIFDFGFGQQSILRLRLMHAYLKVPYVFHLSRNTALLVQNIVNEVSRFANVVLMPILFSLSNLVVIVALLILLVSTDLVATASISIVLLIITAFLYQFRQKLTRWGQDSAEAEVEMIRIVNHSLGGLKEIKLIGCEPYFEAQMAEQAERFKVAATSYNTFSLLPRYSLEVLLISFLIFFVISALLANKSPQSLAATLGVFGMASIRLMPALSNFMNAFGSIRNSLYVVDKLYWDLKELEKVEKVAAYWDGNGVIVDGSSRRANRPSTDLLAFESEICLKHVAYSYPNTAEPALRGISLTLYKGESIGLIGKSGAGKTTLVDVLLGLLPLEDGDIKVDGLSIKSNLRGWQNLIGYIPQSIFLIDDTIEHNIAFGVPDHLIDQKRLHDAIASAQLQDLVDQLPDGVNTLVGERGVRLSGGQRQRVGIARSLYYEREILVLDEATAALDNETEGLVSEAIKSLGSTKTIIIIAHRLSTIEHCDRIYVLEKGQVSKSGSYQEVVLSR